MATVDKPTPPPGQALATYARVFYDELERLATEETDSTGTHKVFTGKLVDVFQSLGLSSIYYTKIRKLFLSEGCVEYMVRGTRSYPSVIVLHHPPPANVKIAPEDLTSPDETAILSEELESLQRAVESLQAWREQAGGLDIAKAFANIEQRLVKLEVQTKPPTARKTGSKSGKKA